MVDTKPHPKYKCFTSLIGNIIFTRVSKLLLIEASPRGKRMAPPAVSAQRLAKCATCSGPLGLFVPVLSARKKAYGHVVHCTVQGPSNMRTCGQGTIRTRCHKYMLIMQSAEPGRDLRPSACTNQRATRTSTTIGASRDGTSRTRCSPPSPAPSPRRSSPRRPATRKRSPARPPARPCFRAALQSTGPAIYFSELRKRVRSSICAQAHARKITTS